ncbi:MAG: arginine repressor [Acidimicrobiia bacterium]
MKPQRQDRIARLLAQTAVSSQGEVVELLSSEGIVATQATVSRDLLELGAVKVRLPGGGMAYAIPESEEVPPVGARLRRVLQEFALRVDSSGNLAVVRTAPGSAHVVASAIDRACLSGAGFDAVLGTVAGDDTLLVVGAGAAGGEMIAAWLQDVSGSAVSLRERDSSEDEMEE